jgi:hypothetical protein
MERRKKMTRKFKPLKWVEENCKKDIYGDFVGTFDNETEIFPVEMFQYCEKEVNVKHGYYEGWHIVEWMLEPFNWFDFITEHFGKFVIGAVILALIAMVLLGLIERGGL